MNTSLGTQSTQVSLFFAPFYWRDGFTSTSEDSKTKNLVLKHDIHQVNAESVKIRSPAFLFRI